ncbi:unnamed protein product [Adineta steineri]|uniref:Uncharacterized protein n=1 Tax=Adineta steineri TaxID=433720 RepID=A0A815ZIA4_9BILA|nr:unnamed protein product [Adineta steineri]CAF1675243.1 unnamed protein product [Adineta steineri]
MKYNQNEKDLSFPIGVWEKREHSLVSSHQLDEIDTLDIEQIIAHAYDQAIHIVKHSKMLDALNQHGINSLDSLSKYIFNVLSKNSRMINYSSQVPADIVEEFGLDEENDDNNIIDDTQVELDDGTVFDPQSDDSSDEEDLLNSTKSDFNGIRIVDDINPALRQSYFKIKINDKIKYLHKQSACWLLTNNITKLSSDRLSRVMKQTADVD